MIKTIWIETKKKAAPGTMPWKKTVWVIGSTMALAILLAVMNTVCHAEAEIYFFIDEDGHYHYSNVPTSDRYAPSELDFIERTRIPESAPESAMDTYDAIIRDTAKTYGVDFALVKAVIRAESAFDPQAVSRKGAQGLMQIMPANFETLNLADPFDPGENIRAGTHYLKALIDRYDHDLQLALAAYNAGPGMVDHYGSIPPFRETQAYVRRVLTYYDRILNDRQ